MYQCHAAPILSAINLKNEVKNAVRVVRAGAGFRVKLNC